MLVKFRSIFFIVALLILLAAGAAFAAMKYECYSYRNGKPDKMIHVLADNNEQAVVLACERFKKMDIIYDYVRCK